jgi:hypothetical protein
MSAIKNSESSDQGKNPGFIDVSVQDAGGEQSLTQAQWDAYISAHPSVKSGLDSYDSAIVNKVQIAAQIAKERDVLENAADMAKLYQKEENALKASIAANNGRSVPSFIDVGIMQSGHHVLQLTQAQWEAYLKSHQNVENSLKSDAAKTKKAYQHPLFRLNFSNLW